MRELKFQEAKDIDVDFIYSRGDAIFIAESDFSRNRRLKEKKIKRAKAYTKRIRR